MISIFPDPEEAPPERPSGGNSLDTGSVAGQYLSDSFSINLGYQPTALVILSAGIVIGALLLLISLLSLSVFCYWRNHPEDKVAQKMERQRESRLLEIDESQLFSQARKEEEARSSIGARYADEANCHNNLGYHDDEDDMWSENVVPNEYVKHPGMVRSSREVQLSVKLDQKGKSMEAEKKVQSSLAGMGALSNMSNLDLSKTPAKAASHQSKQRSSAPPVSGGIRHILKLFAETYFLFSLRWR